MPSSKDKVSTKEDKASGKNDTKRSVGEVGTARGGASGGPVDIEARLNQACTEAKSAHKAHPKNAELLAAYEAAKKVFKFFQEQKVGQKRKVPASETVTPYRGETTTWMCELCQMTLSVREDGRAKEQHLTGKNHLKKLRAQETSAVPAAAADSTGDDKEMFECPLCVCTVISSARGDHETGKTHRSRLEQLHALSAELKKGDWVCCQPKPAHWNGAIQLNFAANSTCCKAGCPGTASNGLTFDEAKKLIAKDRHAKKEASRKTAFVSDGADKNLTCRKCDKPFVFSAKEQVHSPHIHVLSHQVADQTLSRPIPTHPFSSRVPPLTRHTLAAHHTTPTCHAAPHHTTPHHTTPHHITSPPLDNQPGPIANPTSTPTPTPTPTSTPHLAPPCPTPSRPSPPRSGTSHPNPPPACTTPSRTAGILRAEAFRRSLHMRSVPRRACVLAEA